MNKTAPDHVAAIVSKSTDYISDGDLRQVLFDVAHYARNLENHLASNKRSSTPLPIARSPSPTHNCKEEEEDFFIVSERFERFRLDSDADRYFGKSSHFELIDTAIGIKEDLVRQNSLPERTLPPAKRLPFWLSPVRAVFPCCFRFISPACKWENEHLESEPLFPPLVFPEPDLLQSLVSLYFSRVNILVCLLHRPTFEKSLASGLHLVDHQFGSTVLAVCALAAKYSDDPRVVLEGTNTQLSSGWKYFCQFQPLGRSLLRSFTLYEAQTLCVRFHFSISRDNSDICPVICPLYSRLVEA